MKKIAFAFCLCLFALVQYGFTQSEMTYPEDRMSRSHLKSDLYYIASDYLEGRNTGEEGNNIAAKFIASQIEAAGFKPVAGQNSYFQMINFEERSAPTSASLKINKTSFTNKEDFLIVTGKGAKIAKAKAVYAGHGLEADYAGLDVKGKVVFVMGGIPDNNTPQATFTAMAEKRQRAEAKGAVGLIEIYNLSFPWNFFVRYFGGSSLAMPGAADGSSGGDEIVYGWINPTNDPEALKMIREGKKAKVALSSSGFSSTPKPSQNVVGILEGTDPKLKDEYIILSAHYDHVGVGSQGGGAVTEQDSIFNGARDNGVGTVSLLAAARAFGEMPPKRSVIFFACTGEEKGLLGSKYYADNPLVPLDKTIFNLNIDNAGYNDVSLVTIFGFGRTGTNEMIKKAAGRYGLEVLGDPAPEQGLFDRSDNVSFAAKGIPALTYSLGFRAFDDDINKYYHQVTDGPETIDYDYVLKYAQGFARLARMIANNPTRPQWKAGDKYEPAAKALYKK